MTETDRRAATYWRVARWAAWNAVLLWAVWRGAVYGEAGPARLALFAAWSSLLLAAPATFVTDEALREAAEHGGMDMPRLVTALDFLADVAVVSALAWAGWTWSAAAYLVHSLLLASVRARYDKARRAASGDAP